MHWLASPSATEYLPGQPLTNMHQLLFKVVLRRLIGMHSIAVHMPESASVLARHRLSVQTALH
jgi:hypothetical protein